MPRIFTARPIFTTAVKNGVPVNIAAGRSTPAYADETVKDSYGYASARGLDHRRRRCLTVMPPYTQEGRSVEADNAAYRQESAQLWHDPCRWQVDFEFVGTEALAEALSDSWEPFAVEGKRVYLRRKLRTSEPLPTAVDPRLSGASDANE